MFIPDYSMYNKILTAPDGSRQNDLYLARKGSKELSDLIMNKNLQQPVAPSFFDTDNLSDEQLFDSLVPKSVQEPSEYVENYDFNDI